MICEGGFTPAVLFRKGKKIQSLDFIFLFFDTPWGIWADFSLGCFPLYNLDFSFF